MNRILLLSGALALVAAAGPVLADDVELYTACTAPAGSTVITPGVDAPAADVATPLGAANLEAAVTDAGTYYVDLQGLPVGTTADLAFTLAWDSLLPVADYDLITNGDNAFGTDTPETKVVPVDHCSPVAVGVDVFTGLPTDTLTLDAEATEVETLPEDPTEF